MNVHAIALNAHTGREQTAAAHLFQEGPLGRHVVFGRFVIQQRSKGSEFLVASTRAVNGDGPLAGRRGPVCRIDAERSEVAFDVVECSNAVEPLHPHLCQHHGVHAPFHQA